MRTLERMRPIQQLTPSVLAAVIRRQPHSDGRTMLAWQIAVGPQLARATTVRLADRVLTVGASDPRVYGSVAVLLALSTLAATWFPARRAMRVRLVETLSVE